MTQIYFSDGTTITVYESAKEIVRSISAQYPWIQLSRKTYPEADFIVVNSNYILYIEDLENGNICN